MYVRQTCIIHTYSIIAAPNTVVRVLCIWPIVAFIPISTSCIRRDICNRLKIIQAKPVVSRTWVGRFSCSVLLYLSRNTYSWVGLESQPNLSWPTMRWTPRDMDHSWTERAPSSNQLIFGYLVFGFMNDQIILAYVDTAFVVWSTIGGRVRVVGTLIQIMTANLFKEF